ncbi:MAG: amidohydrolase [Candidatus Latescibacteria bacterium]|nr:amidohydrolase [Candidatus Latescibacterota bacterium]MDP7447337.1 amidohydrolase [Candidatus Latescibacterota bacterium]
MDRHRDRIVDLGEAIMDEPELGFKENKTAARVKAVFADLSLAAQDGLALTGVRATLKGGRPGPTVALMGELDALIVPDHPRCDPHTGAAHACGHNAQIAGLMGAAIALTDAGVTEELAGNVVFFAVPAEEYVEIDYRRGLVEDGQTTFLAGKPELVQLGAFDDVDMAVMIHSGSADSLEGTAGVSVSSNGFLGKTICFRGKAAHAGVSPEQGANALNAANIALHAIHAQRETFRDQDCVRVHPILTKGGDIVNIVPAETRMETYVRARTATAMLDAADKVDRCLKGAAMACGCTVEINTVPGYLPLANDRTLAGLFKENVEQLFGAGACCELPHSGGSTDAGDLSQIMPVLHPVMTGAAGTVHGKDWHIADPGAGYLAPAKALAMMAVDLLHDDAVLARRVQAEARPALTKDEYLVQQKAIFGTEVWRAEV